MQVKHEFIAGFLLVSILGTLALWSWGVHQRTLRFEAEAKLVTADVVQAGAHTATLTSPAKVLPPNTPPTIVAAVKAKTITPVAGVTGVAKSNIVYLPCAEVAPLPPDSVTNGTPAKVEIPVTFDVTGHLFVAQVRHGTAIWSGDVAGVAHASGVDVPVVFDPANVNLDVKVSEEIGKAVEAYNQSFWRKHMRFTFPCVSVTYNPLDPTHPVSAGVGAAWGYVW